MADEIYNKLRELLDAIPNGFPKTESGIEIKILKKIFTEEEADIATSLMLKFETPDAIAERTGRDREYLTDKLGVMYKKGQIMGVRVGNVMLYRLIPFIFGIFEFQLLRMDRELALLCEEYNHEAFQMKFFTKKPALMKVVPIEKDIPHGSLIEPYESVSKLIDSAKAWGIAECVCKKEKSVIGEPCSKPVEVCLALAPIENFFDTHPYERPITREEAYRILKISEEAGLIHMTQNTKTGHIYICNCCSCCCGVLGALRSTGNSDALAKSNYAAVVDEMRCTSCGICTDRCQVNAIEIIDFAKINERCIGCGLCVSSCPSEAISLKRRDDADILKVPAHEKEWMARREESRGGNGEYKKLL